MNRHPFECPVCGYRNFQTPEDLLRKSIEADKAIRSLEWSFRHPHLAAIRRALRLPVPGRRRWTGDDDG